MKFFILVCLLIASVFNLRAQELNCQVSIISDARLELTTVDQEMISELENTIYEFMNNTQWTKDKFTVEERINCNLQLQINEIPVSGTFSGSLQVQSSRPAFNSSYNTTLFNFQDDDIAFVYSRGAALLYAPNQYREELSSVLAFYAYYIIGMDYDSYSSRGGTEFLTTAQEIVTNAQSSRAAGWKSSDRGKNNRYWLVDNALHELFSPLRDCNYEYHRKGIDMLYEDKTIARNKIELALSKLVKVTATRPNSLNVLNFVQAKTNELKSMYSEAEMKEKNKIVNLLKRIDPANSSKYQEILN
ncbi:MAG: DUF4835 family protein [Crocinitomicaceae bacterium]|nr:DUF4835 family protein [Crocinitomicaceae bacterium]MDG1777356.1 DUF4835 family protein [Crocinitomicaceae bacterium]